MFNSKKKGHFYQHDRLFHLNLNFIIFAIILILYNPIAPVHLSREIWMPINFITAGIYIYGFFKIKKQIQ